MIVEQRPNRAIAAALALSRAPTLAKAMRQQQVPPDVVGLLRVFARDEAAISEAMASTGESHDSLVASIDNYVQAILLFPGAPPRRMLAASSNASRNELRTNFKLLLTGLHPDKTRDPWRANYARRVIAAWKEAPPAAISAPDASRQHKKRPKVRLPWIASPLPRRRSSRKARGIFIIGLIFVCVAAVNWRTELGAGFRQIGKTVWLQFHDMRYFFKPGRQERRPEWQAER